MRWLACILALVTFPAAGSTCRDKAMLEAFLKYEYGLRLHSWGINKSGNMIELWLADNGLFAVVTTTPSKCSTVDLPDDLYGRLWVPPTQNKAIPEDFRMNRGDRL